MSTTLLMNLSCTALLNLLTSIHISDFDFIIHRSMHHTQESLKESYTC